MKNPLSENSLDPNLSQLVVRGFSNKKNKIKEIKNIRTSILIAIASSTLVSFTIISLAPNNKNRPKYQFPDRISLPDWQYQPRDLSSDKSKDALINISQVGAIDTRSYFYNSPSQENLRVDAMYIKSVVDVPAYLKKLDLNYANSSFKVSHSDSVGYYVLFAVRDRAYLSSCINPNGKATVTYQQFMDNRNTYDMSSDRVLSYLIGTDDLRDTRCLFTIISVPLEIPKTEKLNSDSLNNFYKKLERVWFTWYRKWENDFPNQ